MPLSLGPGHAAALDALQPSPYWGSGAHLGHARQQPQLDVRRDRAGCGWRRRVRGADNPAFCKAGSDHPSAKAFPMDRAVRHLAVFDPKTKKYTFVDTCYRHAPPAVRLRRQRHAVDERRRSGRRLAEHEDVRPTGDAAKSQGWTALILDTNGNGKRDAYVEPNQPVDPTKDKRVNSPFYAVMPSPADGSIWGDAPVEPGRGRAPRAGRRIRRRRRSPRSTTCRCRASASRGGDIDSKGVVWVSLAQRPHRQLRSPQVQGAAQRPEGDRRSLPRGLVVPQVSRSRLPGHRRQQRRVELLLVGRSAQHVRPRQRRADVDRQPERRPDRLRERPDGRAARAVSDGLLRQGLRRPHRRSEAPAGRAAACGPPTAIARRG